MTKLYATVHRQHDNGSVGNVYAVERLNTKHRRYIALSSPGRPAVRLSVKEALDLMAERSVFYPNTHYFMRTCDE